MARRIVISCDHCDADQGVEPVQIQMEGKRLKLDLCPEGRAILKEWGAVPVPTRRTRTSRAKTPVVLDLDENGEPIVPA